MTRPVRATTRNMRIAESTKTSITPDSGMAPAAETSVCARSLVMMTTAAEHEDRRVDEDVDPPRQRHGPGRGGQRLRGVAGDDDDRRERHGLDQRLDHLPEALGAEHALEAGRGVELLQRRLHPLGGER